MRTSRIGTLVRRLSRLGCSPTVVRIAVAILLVQLTAMSASAQRPLQRLGDRLRARLTTPAPESAADVAASPPTADAEDENEPGVAAVNDRPGSGTGMIPRSANFNRSAILADRGFPPATSTADETDSPGVDNGAWINRQNPISVAAAEVIPPPVMRSRLGVVVASPPEESRPGLPPRRPRGAWVSEVLPRSAAEVAGLTAGDRLIAIDGRLIHSVPDLLEELKRREAGDRVRIAYSRNAQLRQAIVTLAGADGIAPVDELAADRSRDSEAAGSGSMLRGFGSMLGGLLGGGAESGAAPSAPAPAPAAVDNPESEPVEPLQD